MPVAASFASDTFYQAASATSSVDVFVPPATGAFVIGDKSAGSPTIGKAVNFWGAALVSGAAGSPGGSPGPGAA